MSTDIKFSTANFKAKHSRFLLAFFMYFLKMLGLKGLVTPSFCFRGQNAPYRKCAELMKKRRMFFCFAQMLSFGNATNNEWRSKYLHIGVKVGFAGPLVGLHTMSFPVIRSFCDQNTAMNRKVINLDMGNPLRAVKSMMVLALTLLALWWSEEIVDLAIWRDSSRTEVLWLSPNGETRPERVKYFHVRRFYFRDNDALAKIAKISDFTVCKCSLWVTW
jgi:hypothetical protein